MTEEKKGETQAVPEKDEEESSTMEAKTASTEATQEKDEL